MRKAKWIVLNVRGFTTSDEAQHFGANLSLMVQLASLASHLGVDVGENKATSWMREEFARSLGLLKDHERVAPNIHGLAVLPDDDLTRFPVMNAEGTVTADPEQFTSALRELGDTGDVDFKTASNGVRLLNLALMTNEPLAQMVLALSAIEELGQNQKWSEAQLNLIERLAKTAESSTEAPFNEITEVADAIRKGLFPLSLRQGVLRLLTRFNLTHLRKEWDRLYKLRSSHFHGTARLTASELNEAASDTIKLCCQIILGILSNEGTIVPSVASKHF